MAGIRPYQLILVTGIGAFIALVITFSIGMLGWSHMLHKYLAIATLLFASIHLLLVIYVRKIKRRQR